MSGSEFREADGLLSMTTALTDTWRSVADHRVDSRDPLAIAVSFRIVRDRHRIIGDVELEIVGVFSESFHLQEASFDDVNIVDQSPDPEQ